MANANIAAQVAAAVQAALATHGDPTPGTYQDLLGSLATSLSAAVEARDLPRLQVITTEIKNITDHLKLGLPLKQAYESRNSEVSEQEQLMFRLSTTIIAAVKPKPSRGRAKARPKRS